MAEGSIDKLSIEIASNASNATKNIKELSASLTGLKSSVGSGAATLTELSRAMESLKAASSGVKLTSVANSMQKLSAAMASMPADTATKLSGLKSLSSLGNVKVGQLGKLPTILNEFSKLNISGLSTQMRELNSALGPLSASVERLATAYSAMPRSMRAAGTAARSVKSANENLTGATNALAVATNRAQTSMSLFSGIRGRVMAFSGAMYTLKRAFEATIGEVNTYIENMNLFEASMGSATQQATDFGTKVQDLMGIDFGEWARNQGVFQTLATGMGVSAEKANTMSQQLTQLGYDIASFYNLDVSEAMLKLQSGLAGELEPLRRIGWDLSNARMNLELTKMGIEGNAQSMTQAEKVALRYKMIMEQVTITHGDMARTLASPANQIRVLKAQITLAARAIGSLFIPMLNKILPAVIGAVKAIRLLAQEIANFFGIDANFEVDYSNLDTSGIASDSDDAADAIEDTADALDDAGSAADKAAKKVKEYQNTVMGFDELNKLNATPEYDTGSDSGSSAADKLDNLKNGVGADFGLPTYDFLDGIDKAITDLSDEIAKKLVKAFHDILPIVIGIGAAIAAWKIGNALIRNADKIADAMRRASNHAGRLSTRLRNTKMGETKIGSKLITPLDKAQTGLAKIADKFKVVAAAPAAMLPELALAAAGIGVLVMHFANLSVNSENFQRGIKWIAEKLQDLPRPLELIQGAAEKISGFFGGIADNIKEWWDNLPDVGFWGTFKDIVEGIAGAFDWAKNAVIDFLDRIGLLDAAKEIAEQVGGAFGELGDAISYVAFDVLDLKWTDAVNTAGGALLLAFGPGPISKITGAVMLIGEAVSLVARAIGEATSPVIESVDALADVSEDTADRFGTSLTSMEDAITTLDALDFSNAVVTEEDKQRITQDVQDIHDTIVNNLDAKRNEELASIEALAGVLTPEEVEEAKKKVNEYYDDLKGIIDDGSNEITSIIAGAQAEGRGLAEEESARIKEITDEQYKYLLETSGASAEDLNKIREAMDNNDKASALAAAEQVIKAAKEAKDGQIQAAEDTYNTTHEWATRMRDNGDISEEEYQRIMDAAEETKKVTIQEAEDQYDGILQETKDGLGDVADEMDWQTGEIKEKWQGWLGGLYDRWNETLGNLKMSVQADMTANMTWTSGFTGQDMGYYGGYATGGFPETGQIFMARENGDPELVGRMGRRTAVANNAQIVDGIEAGVTNAMVKVMASQGTTNQRDIVIPLYIGSEEIARAVHKGEASLVRRGEIKIA